MCKVNNDRKERTLTNWILDELSDMGWNVKPSDVEEKPPVE